MKKILYIEHKTNQNDKGKAWIGLSEFSKSGKTIYFNNKAFKKQTCIAYANINKSNYYYLETDECYWISGIKKNDQDRHQLGSGKILIDKNIVNHYLLLMKLNDLNLNKYKIVNILPKDKKHLLLLKTNV